MGTQKDLSTKLRTEACVHHLPEKTAQNMGLNFLLCVFFFFSIAIVFHNNSQGVETLLAFKEPVRRAIKVMKILLMAGV